MVRKTQTSGMTDIVRIQASDRTLTKIDLVMIMHRWNWKMRLPEEETQKVLEPRWEPKENDFVYGLTGEYSGLNAEYQGQPAKVKKELTEADRRRMDEDRRDLYYSYFLSNDRTKSCVVEGLLCRMV